jgi:tripeptidyl-peptidase-1
MERTLMEVSDPGHARYGQHLKRDELKDLIKPREESTAAVLSWLEESGVYAEDIQNDGEWISFHAPVERAESMMDTSFKVYQNEVRPGVKRIRSLSYSVPRAVRDHIDLIQPTTRFGQIRTEGSNVLTQEDVPFSVASADAVDSSCDTTVTPACLRNLYNFADYNVSTKVAVKLGITGYLEQYARYADLKQFTDKFSPFAKGSNFSFTSVKGMHTSYVTNGFCTC